MEIKTTQEITGRLTRPNVVNKKWVAIDDLIRFIDNLRHPIVLSIETESRIDEIKELIKKELDRG